VHPEQILLGVTPTVIYTRAKSSQTLDELTVRIKSLSTDEENAIPSREIRESKLIP
jgi:hypothetical protein